MCSSNFQCGRGGNDARTHAHNKTTRHTRPQSTNTNSIITINNNTPSIYFGSSPRIHSQTSAILNNNYEVNLTCEQNVGVFKYQKSRHIIHVTYTNAYITPMCIAIPIALAKLNTTPSWFSHRSNVLAGSRSFIIYILHIYPFSLLCIQSIHCVRIWLFSGLVECKYIHT